MPLRAKWLCTVGWLDAVREWEGHYHGSGRQLVVELQHTSGAGRDRGTSRYIGLVGRHAVGHCRTAVAVGLVLTPCRDIGAAEAGRGVSHGLPGHSLVAGYLLSCHHEGIACVRGQLDW